MIEERADDPRDLEGAGERTEEGPTDEAVLREESRAAAEAGAIGGEAPEAAEDSAWQPVEEAGGGEAEGFEQAEADLQEHAQHGDDFRHPIRDAFPVEEAAERSGASYGDPDRRDPPEPGLAREDDVEAMREPER
jgi:hypothetical protein